ncbi:hypothetical protein MLD38_020180 [Melastoma candidum]|uniref:Uncharacterized protein n=1 Tax=Melastoma candidum TaxID=119954 RepID=A0ACB9QCE7_9MYRT|nr:hypothetical protein MLD38_020180 [Melastoma candidum]
MSFFNPTYYYNYNTTGSGGPIAAAGITTCVALLFVTFVVYFICCRSMTSRLHPDPTPQTLTTTSRPPQEQHHVAPTVNPGINDATIEGFPRLLYSDLKQLHETRGFTTASSCSICLKDYDPGDDLRLLPDCGHLFHSKCIDPWLLSRVTCPVCRTSPLPRPASTRG